MANLARSDTWLITVSINGALVPTTDGVWDTFKGGDIDSTADVYHAGGMKAQEAVGGIATISTVTIEKALDIGGDWGEITQLMTLQKEGVGNRQISISKQLLDLDKNPKGSALIYNGIMKSIATGDTDSNKSDIQMWTVTAVVQGPVGSSA